jgi:hypothetical protein
MVYGVMSQFDMAMKSQLSDVPTMALECGNEGYF